MRGLRERRCGRSAAPYARRRRREAGVVRGRARATPRLASRPLPPPRGIPASHYTASYGRGSSSPTANRGLAFAVIATTVVAATV